MKTKRDIDRERRRLIDTAAKNLTEIEQYFVDIEHWNNRVRKPDEAVIVADEDGAMKNIAAALAKMLCAESVHKIPRDQWLADIKRVAMEKMEFTEQGIASMDWSVFFESYYLDCTPEQALIEDMNA